MIINTKESTHKFGIVKKEFQNGGVDQVVTASICDHGVHNQLEEVLVDNVMIIELILQLHYYPA